MTQPRREFLTQIAATAATAAVATYGRPLAAEAPGSATGTFDDSWTKVVHAAKHKAVFDSPDIADGQALTQAWIYRRGYEEALGDTGAAVVPIVVVRHMSVSLAIDDALWAKYKIGALRKIDDPATKAPAERNPWSRTPPGKEQSADLVAVLGPTVDPTVEGVIRAGGIVLACNLALGRVAGSIAKQVDSTQAAILAELRAGLVPGVIVQPSGVYATARAQEVGATFMRS